MPATYIPTGSSYRVPFTLLTDVDEAGAVVLLATFACPACGSQIDPIRCGVAESKGVIYGQGRVFFKPHRPRRCCGRRITPAPELSDTASNARRAETYAVTALMDDYAFKDFGIAYCGRPYTAYSMVQAALEGKLVTR